MTQCSIAASPPNCITEYRIGLSPLFHIRIAVDREKKHMPLTVAPRAQALLDSARFYETKERWHITLFLLMPDHLHALLSFATDESMSKIIGDWKHFQSRKHGIIWQQGYFDHRLRDDERGQQLSMKINYIRQNPVAAGLCATPDNWPWVIGRFIPGGSSSPLLEMLNNGGEAAFTNIALATAGKLWSGRSTLSEPRSDVCRESDI